MRLLICAGGTGGGVYPALAVLQAETNQTDIEVLWVGSDDGMEADIVRRAGIDFTGIPAAGIHGVSLLSLPGRVMKLLRGYIAAGKVLKAFRPDVLFFTGGYVGFPTAAAGRNIPSVLFVPDIEPGMALNALSKNADRIAVVCEESGKYFPGKNKIAVTGYPTRRDIRAWDKQQALQYFGLNDQLPVLFVFGGSKGARSINRALLKQIQEMTSFCQVIHICGNTDKESVEAAYRDLPEEVRTRYKLFPYLHEEMGAAFTAADLVVSRSGASTLGEFPLFGVPAVLVPYPYAWRYQKTNADYLVSRGAAELLRDEELDEQLLPTVRRLLTDTTHLEQMKQAMAAQARPNAAKDIFALLCQCAKEGKQHGR